MAIETEAYVLRVYPLGESDRIVVFLCRRAGKVRGVARHAALSRRRFGGSLSVLSRVRIRFTLRTGRDLASLDSCELEAPMPGEGRNLEAFYVCAYLAEILEQFSHEGEADENLYRLTAAVCQAMATGHSPVAMARYFELWTLRLAGLLPALRICPECRVSLVHGGALVIPGAEPSCLACGPGASSGGQVLVPTAVALVQQILHRPPGDAVFSQAATEDFKAIEQMTRSQFLAVVEHPFRTGCSVSGRRHSGWPASLVSS